MGGTAIDGRSSIGAALARFLKEEDAIVLPVSSNREKVKKTLIELNCHDEGIASKLTVDIADKASVDECIAWVINTYKKIDILINAQGISLKKPTTSMTMDEWQKIIMINLVSTSYICQIVGNSMIKQNSGHIINITSATALKGFSELAAYGSSKGGIRSLTQHLACEWAKHGICVNSIAPGWFITAMNREILAKNPGRLERVKQSTPAGRIGDNEFEDLRAPLIFLTTCTPYVNGITIPVDGGLTHSGF